MFENFITVNVDKRTLHSKIEDFHKFAKSWDPEN